MISFVQKKNFLLIKNKNKMFNVIIYKRIKSFKLYSRII